MKERLIEFLSYLEIGQTKFEEKVGLSRGFVNTLKDNPTVKTIEKILVAYPELNKDWLIDGKGEMIKNSQQIGSATNSTVVGANVFGNGHSITHNDFTEMIELQKGYQELLRKKDEHITELLLIVNKLTRDE